MTRLDVLYVGTLPPHRGGSAIWAGQVLAGLQALGHAVRAVAPITSDGGGRGDAFASRHPALEVVRYVVPYLESARDRLVPDAYRRVERGRIAERVLAQLERRPPDVVLIGRESFAWHVPDLVRDRPSVLVVHGGRNYNLVLAGSAKGRRLLEHFRKASLVITVARHMAVELRRVGLKRLLAIPNPVDLRLFAPRSKSPRLQRDLALADDDVVVLHVSKLSSQKRPLDLVYSAERALQRDRRLVYVIVGDGPLRQTMEEACRARGLRERFRFVGWVDHARVADYLNLADIVLLPSEFEGQAQVILEAQACARLIVTSDIAGVREVITHGRDGLVVRKGRIGELTAATLRAAGDPELRAKLGRGGRSSVKRHALERTIGAYAEALERVAGQVGRGPSRS